MAKVKIQGNASGTGVLTVTAPNTSTDRTITLPDSTGTLATTADSVGGATGVDFNDNVKARFGTGNDLEIYHDGSNTFISEASGTGTLYIRATDLILKSGADNDDYIKCHENGDVKLYHSNAEKLATIANGVLLPNNQEIRFKDNSGNERTAVMFDSSNVLSIGHSTSGGKTQFKGGGSYTTVAEIDNNGFFRIRNFSAGGHAAGAEFNTNGKLTISIDASSANLIGLYNENGNVGNISVSGSSTSYGTSSDHRLKENVNYDWDATTRVKQLKPARFNFIADDTNTLVDGFLAHEVSSIVPEAIRGAKDAVDDDGNPVYQEIDQSKLVPLLVKTIQELEARITELENA